MFICGGDPFVRDIARLLNANGVSQQQIYGTLEATALQGGPVHRADHARLLDGEYKLAAQVK